MRHSLCVQMHVVAFQEVNDFTESLKNNTFVGNEIHFLVPGTAQILKWGKGLWSFYSRWQSVTNMGVSGSICGGDCLPAWIRGSKSGPKLLPSDTIAIGRTYLKQPVSGTYFFVVMFLWGSNNSIYCCERQVLWPNWPEYTGSLCPSDVALRCLVPLLFLLYFSITLVRLYNRFGVVSTFKA